METCNPGCQATNPTHPPVQLPQPHIQAPPMNHPCTITARNATMTSKMESRRHTTRRLSKISLTSFDSVVIGHVMSLILREYGVVTVRKNVLDNGLNSGALSPTGTDANINNTIGAAHNTTSNFTNSRAELAANDDVVFGSTAVSLLSAATIAIIRIVNENMFNRGPLLQRATQSPAYIFIKFGVLSLICM